LVCDDFNRHKVSAWVGYEDFDVFNFHGFSLKLVCRQIE
jgi:hypothetical protein